MTDQEPDFSPAPDNLTGTISPALPAPNKGEP